MVQFGARTTKNLSTPERGLRSVRPKNCQIKEMQSSPRRAILILGMHRSGTSALARLISEFGAALPANLMPANADNEMGYWESLPVNQALEGVLRAAGSSWTDWRSFNSKWHRRLTSAGLVGELKRAIKSEYGQSSLFVLKDPRLCRLVPLIKEVLIELNINPCAILMVREPLEVIASLQKREKMSAQDAQLLWERHVLDAESETRDWPRAFVTYEGLLKDWRYATSNFAKLLELQWPISPIELPKEVDELISRHQHHQQKRSIKIADIKLKLDEKAYRLIEDYARTGTDHTHAAELDRIYRRYIHHMARLASRLERPVRGAPPSATGRLFRWLMERVRGQTAPTELIPHVEKAFPKVAELLKSDQKNDQLSEEVRRLLDLYVASWPFDEEQYLQRYPEIAEAVRAGHFASGREHFRQVGYLEGRLPITPVVDADWYLKTYPDVASAAEKNSSITPASHFIGHGYREGRSPCAQEVDPPKSS